MSAPVTPNTDSPRIPQRWRISWQGYVPVLLMIILGAATTWALNQEVTRLEDQRVETTFSAGVRDRVLVVQRELQTSHNPAGHRDIIRCE